ncbi:MAG: hypothetical protein ABWX70_02425 [Hyphomicrobium sp.]|jgi:hypothetical protein
MSDPNKNLDEAQTPDGQVSQQDLYTSTDLSRRSVLTAVAAAALAATGSPRISSAANSSLMEDMILFVLLSSALTGVTEGKLAGLGRKPGSTVDLNKLSVSDLAGLGFAADPVDIKREYFVWVNEKEPVLFERMLQLTRDNLNPADKTRKELIIEKVNAASELKFLGRSIVLMWYLGAWYEPADLRKASTVDKPEFVPHTIISSKAYKEGWIWRIAQAHPMGSSDMQFGYWANAPKMKLDHFIGP